MADELDADIYCALLDISEVREDGEWDVGDIAERAGVAIQETEKRLHGFQDVGMVDWREGTWYPVIRFEDESEEGGEEDEE
ncbi:MAG: hypothetical protein ABEJ82_02815 [Haloplanus sp.]